MAATACANNSIKLSHSLVMKRPRRVHCDFFHAVSSIFHSSYMTFESKAVTISQIK